MSVTVPPCGHKAFQFLGKYFKQEGLIICNNIPLSWGLGIMEETACVGADGIWEKAVPSS